MSEEEIERYNVLANEIRNAGLAIGRIETHTASRELTLAKLMAAITQLSTEKTDFEHNHLKAMEERIEKEAAGRYERLLSLISILHEDSLKHLGKCVANFEESLVKQLKGLTERLERMDTERGVAKLTFRPKRKRERKHRKAA